MPAASPVAIGKGKKSEKTALDVASVVARPPSPGQTSKRGIPSSPTPRGGKKASPTPRASVRGKRPPKQKSPSSVPEDLTIALDDELAEVEEAPAAAGMEDGTCMCVAMFPRVCGCSRVARRP